MGEPVGRNLSAFFQNLELYFEHRNYFPGIGLFLLLGVLLAGAFKRWPEVRQPALLCLAGLVIWLAIVFGILGLLLLIL